MNYFISSWISTQGPLQVFSTIGGLHIVSHGGLTCFHDMSADLTLVHLLADYSYVDIWKTMSQHDCQMDHLQEDSRRMKGSRPLDRGVLRRAADGSSVIIYRRTNVRNPKLCSCVQHMAHGCLNDTIPAGSFRYRIQN